MFDMFRSNKMRIDAKKVLVLTVKLLLFAVLTGTQNVWAQTDANNAKFPYVAGVIGLNVNVRSGAGTNYYSCGKMSEPMRVVVVDRKYIWSKILPPQGSFSWIFKQYVRLDADNPKKGYVTSENVRVYAGAENMDPIHCDVVQMTLNAPAAVQILQKPAGDYYKIVPPEGACLWTSSQYLKFIRDAGEIELQLPKETAEPSEKPQSLIAATEPAQLNGQTARQKRLLESYYNLAKKFKDEKSKPITQQNYSNIKIQLEKMLNDPNSGDAGSYAKYLLKQIARCQLAEDSQKMVTGQQKSLKQILNKIDRNLKNSKAKISSLGRFAVTGTLKTSMVYEADVTTKRFLVIDASGNPICYAEPKDAAAAAEAGKLTGQNVGLIGRITADSKSNLAMVKFEKIEKLKTEKKTEK